MKTSRIAAIIALILLLVACAGPASAADIFAVGGWSVTTQIIGEELVGAYESAADATLLTISGAPGPWSLDVRRIDQSWNPNLVLSVQRTGNGSGGSGGSGGLSGGMSYQAITPSDTLFIQGSRNRSNIPVQMKLTGVSMDVPPGTYSTTITYTVVDNW